MFPRDQKLVKRHRIRGYGEIFDFIDPLRFLPPVKYLYDLSGKFDLVFSGVVSVLLIYFVDLVVLESGA